MNFNREQQDDVEINVTSLIDVVLLLLIFFMVSTTFLNPAHINLTLPQASASAEKKEEPQAIEVTVDSEGRYYVNSQALVNSRLETLKQSVMEAAKGLKEPPIVIHADAKTTHQSVVNVLDVARQLGLVRISFATEIKRDDNETAR